MYETARMEWFVIDVEIFGMLVACLSHDLDDRGVFLPVLKWRKLLRLQLGVYHQTFKAASTKFLHQGI
uniref:Uncharacterized protein n=1 Tax=Glossina brevipalpis TaxID=37001 RepID=A0A1A9WJR5_9MUSC